jgi:hypothetical protein
MIDVNSTLWHRVKGLASHIKGLRFGLFVFLASDNLKTSWMWECKAFTLNCSSLLQSIVSIRALLGTWHCRGYCCVSEVNCFTSVRCADTVYGSFRNICPVIILIIPCHVHFFVTHHLISTSPSAASPVRNKHKFCRQLATVFSLFFIYHLLHKFSELSVIDFCGHTHDTS